MDPYVEVLGCTQPIPADVRLVYNVFMLMVITVLSVCLIKLQRRFDAVKKVIEVKILHEKILVTFLTGQLKKYSDQFQTLSQRKIPELSSHELQRLDHELEKEQTKKKDMLNKSDLLLSKHREECAQSDARYQALKVEKDMAMKQLMELKSRSENTENCHKTQLDMYKEHSKENYETTKQKHSYTHQSNINLINRLKAATEDMALQKQRLTDIKNEINKIDKENEKTVAHLEQKAYDIFIESKKALKKLNDVRKEMSTIKGHNCPVDHFDITIRPTIKGILKQPNTAINTSKNTANNTSKKVTFAPENTVYYFV